MVTGTLTKGGDFGISFRGDLAIFIDCEPGGFNNTSQFTENSSEITRAISGLNADGTARTVANFANGFYADYALVVGVGSGGALYHLTQTDSGPVMEVAGPVTFGPRDNFNLPSYTFTFWWQSLGLTPSLTNFFKFETVYASEFGSRYPESFENVTVTGIPGWGTLNFSNYDVYGVDPVPETANEALIVFGGLIVLVVSARTVRTRFKDSKTKGRLGLAAGK